MKGRVLYRLHFIEPFQSYHPENRKFPRMFSALKFHILKIREQDCIFDKMCRNPGVKEKRVSQHPSEYVVSIRGISQDILDINILGLSKKGEGGRKRKKEKETRTVLFVSLEGHVLC